MEKIKHRTNVYFTLLTLCYIALLAGIIGIPVEIVMDTDTKVILLSVAALIAVMFINSDHNKRVKAFKENRR